MVKKPGLRSPANMKSAVHMALAPLHYVAEFMPVHHTLERHLLDRRARDNHAVKKIIFNAVEIFIKRKHMFKRSVFRNPSAHRQKLYLDLQRRVAQKTRQLRFRGNLRGH